jgi:hypothetical protein
VQLPDTACDLLATSVGSSKAGSLLSSLLPLCGAMCVC